jgi:hypothetical protein
MAVSREQLTVSALTMLEFFREKRIHSSFDLKALFRQRYAASRDRNEYIEVIWERKEGYLTLSYKDIRRGIPIEFRMDGSNPVLTLRCKDIVPGYDRAATDCYGNVNQVKSCNAPDLNAIKSELENLVLH